jgi:RimJ/RimL family protein N-acetyltransferase
MFPDLTRDDVFRLETQRLWLRWPRASDAAAIRRIVSVDEVARQTAMIPHPYPAGAAEAHILAARAGAAEGRAIELAMTLKTTREVIGQIHARLDAGEIEVGYLVATEHWDNGYASEALAALVDVVFALTFAQRIGARVLIDNEASAHVLEKQGFTAVGEETVELPPRGGARRRRRYVLERAARDGLRLRQVPAMSQQSMSQQGAASPPALGAPRAPETARSWM